VIADVIPEIGPVASAAGPFSCPQPFLVGADAAAGPSTPVSRDR